MSAEDARLFAVAAELGRIGAFLSDLIGDDTRRLAVLERTVSFTGHEEAWRRGYELGAAAREALAAHDPDLPISAPIVSVQRTLETFGVHVASVSFQTYSKHAVSVARPGSVPVVLLNVRHDRVLQPIPRRAVLAHELGHLLHDVGESDLAPTDQTPSAYSDAVEQRANGFAPAFVATPEAIRDALDGIAEPQVLVQRLAADWGFTAEGAIWHAKNCQLITHAQAEDLIVDHAFRTRVSRAAGSSARWEPELLHDDPRDHGLDVETTNIVGGLVQRLVLRALRQGAISAGRAKEILTLS